MPVAPVSAYNTAEDVMNMARAFVNDSFSQGAGRILVDNASFSVQYLNSALQVLQDRIGNAGNLTLVQDNYLIENLPAVVSIDPAVQCSVSYTGYYNGTAIYPAPLVIPGNCISIKELWQRQTGSGLPFTRMSQAREGLASCVQQQYFGEWEYRGDSIYLNGATVPMDLRVRYELRFAQISPATPQNPWSGVQISVLASVNQLATIVAYLYARARGAAAAPAMKADAEEQIRLIENRYIRRAQAVPYHRKPYQDEADPNGIALPY